MAFQNKKVEFNLNDYDITPLPFSDGLERAVLCAIFDMPGETIPIAMKTLTPKGMFYDNMNAYLWGMIRNITKTSEFRTDNLHKILEAERAPARLAHFVSICSEPTDHKNFQSNCLLLNEFWIARTIHRMGHYLNQNSINKGFDTLELLGLATDSLDKIYRHISQIKEVTIQDGITALAQELVAISNSPDGMLGLPFSIKGLNKTIKGKRRGNFIVIAGSTGEGKTTLEMQEIRHSAENASPVGCFSLEMKTEELLLIMACSALDIPTELVLSGHCNAHQITQIGGYMERIKKMPLKILDKPAIKIGELKSVARMWVKDFGIKEIWIDHIHLMEGDVPYGNVELKFTDIANQLKALSKELDIPIIALAQFHRKEKGDKSMHKISDLKYSSGIEQAADVIILLYRPELYEIESFPQGHKRAGQSTKGYTRIHVGKLRLLPKNDTECHFDGMSFTDMHEWEYTQKDEVERPDNPRAGINYNPNKTHEPENKSDLPF